MVHEEVVILSAARTAIGSFGGGLSGLGAVELGITAAKAAIDRSRLHPHNIDEVIIGNVLSAGLGQNVARQIALGAGLPSTIPAMSIGKVCGSGLRSVSLAAQVILAGDADFVLAGGTESMSQSPYVLRNNRFGKKMGNDVLVDSMICDGLWDAFNDYHMGITAENIAQQWGITREVQDAFALESQKKACAAIDEGLFEKEIVPIPIPSKRGAMTIMKDDEFPRKDSTLEALAMLKSAFKKEGTVTAGNASGINDGAAMLIIASKKKALEQNLPILAVIRGYASGGVEPAIMGIGVVPAVKLALQKAKLSIDEIGLVELNEAFAAQSIACIKELGVNPQIINVNGGAIALGHPIGASGARILTTLLHEMDRRGTNFGLAALCIGGGMGTAVVVEHYRK